MSFNACRRMRTKTKSEGGAESDFTPKNYVIGCEKLPKYS